MLDTATAGEKLEPGDMVYYRESDGKLYKSTNVRVVRDSAGRITRGLCQIGAYMVVRTIIFVAVVTLTACILRLFGVVIITPV